MIDGPYRVVRVPVWGHPARYSVVGRPQQGGRVKAPTFKERGPADRLCDRMNADYERYQWVVWAKRSA